MNSIRLGAIPCLRTVLAYVLFIPPLIWRQRRQRKILDCGKKNRAKIKKNQINRQFFLYDWFCSLRLVDGEGQTWLVFCLFRERKPVFGSFAFQKDTHISFWLVKKQHSFCVDVWKGKFSKVGVRQEKKILLDVKTITIFLFCVRIVVFS